MHGYVIRDGRSQGSAAFVATRGGTFSRASYNPPVAPVNNVTRLLDVRGVEYEVFILPPRKLSAQETAVILGTTLDAVLKTIVVIREPSRRPLLVLVAGDAQVDLKKTALAIGEKKVRLPTEREAQTVTGLEAGGISPLALLNKGFRVLIDRSTGKHPWVHVSGGQRGLNIRLRVDDLAHLTAAEFADVSKPLPILQDDV